MIFPAIDIQRSGTRREELLLDENTIKQIWLLRRMVTMIASDSTNFAEAIERVLDRMAKTRSNAEFLEKLKATPEGRGSLLDHSIYLYGSGMGNPNVHDHTDLPILVAGGAAGNMRGGRHIQFDEPTPLANLHLTLLNKVGVPLDSFADSQGQVDELFEPLDV